MRVELQNLNGSDMGYLEFPDGAPVPREGERIEHVSSLAPDTPGYSIVRGVTWLTESSELRGVRLVLEYLPLT